MLIVRWWTFVVRGLLAIAFGGITLMTPDMTVLSFARLFGMYAVAEAILNGIGAFQSRPRSKDAATPRAEPWWMVLIEAVAGAIFGIVCLLTAHRLIFFSVLYLVGAWALITGLFEIAAGFGLGSRRGGKWLFAAAGSLSAICGVGALACAIGQLTATPWIAAYAIAFGLLLILLGLRLKGGDRSTMTSESTGRPANPIGMNVPRPS